MAKKTLVLGASGNPARYSYLAINRLRRSNHPVVAIGRRKAMVADTVVDTELQEINDLDTITLYLNPTNQKPYYQYILDQRPRRIIFNPGTENEELEELARENGIEAVQACTLVMLSTGQY